MATSPPFTIRQAQSPADLAAIRALFTAYTESLGIDLAFQSYASELASLPGAYSPPRGALLLAIDDTHPDPNPNPNADSDSDTAAAINALGCMGVRPLPYNNEAGTVSEAKRLYVAPSGRGQGVGQALIEAGVAAARAAGYVEMKLDTLASMADAQRLYRRYGFVETEAYYDNPNEGTVYMSLRLGE